VLTYTLNRSELLRVVLSHGIADQTKSYTNTTAGLQMLLLIKMTREASDVLCFISCRLSVEFRIDVRPVDPRSEIETDVVVNPAVTMEKARSRLEQTTHDKNALYRQQK
jgi:hypothetical protein